MFPSPLFYTVESKSETIHMEYFKLSIFVLFCYFELTQSSESNINSQMVCINSELHFPGIQLNCKRRPPHFNYVLSPNYSLRNITLMGQHLLNLYISETKQKWGIKVPIFPFFYQFTRLISVILAFCKYPQHNQIFNYDFCTNPLWQQCLALVILN